MNSNRQTLGVSPKAERTLLAMPFGATVDRSIEHPGRMSIAIINGAIAPYTSRFYDAVAEKLDVELDVLVCEAVEPQRKWDLPTPRNFTLIKLAGLRYHASYTSHIYFNPGVLTHLIRRRPNLVILDGFSPTMLLAALWAFAVRVPIAVTTDGSQATDPGSRSILHRVMRRFLVPRAAVGIGASEDSLRLLYDYGLMPGRGAVVPIMSAWDGPPADQQPNFDDRAFDILFSGSIDDQRKGAMFFADVLDRLVHMGQHPKVRVIGDGPLRSKLEDRLRAAGISYRFDGYLQQADLAEAYASARLLLFPSRGDPWGLVANEALMCGTPVIGSPHAVSCVELVERFGAGLVLPLDADRWCRAVHHLLADRTAWTALQDRHEEARAWFSEAACVEAMRRAIALGTNSEGEVLESKSGTT